MKQVLRVSHFLICSLCCLIFIGEASANNQEDEAEVLFQNKQYEEALDIWYGLVQSGNAGAGIYYNIGVSQSLLGNTPMAILAFEKALRFKPSNNKINDALVQERKKIKSAVIPVPTFFLTRWIEFVLSFLRPGYWAMIGLFFFLLLTGWIINPKHKVLKNRERVRSQILILLTTGILFILCAWLSYCQIYRTDEAIVVIESIFRQAPSVDSPPIRTIYPGEKVIVLDQIGNWYQVSLLNLDEGWVQKETLDFILIDGEGPSKG